MTIDNVDELGSMLNVALAFHTAAVLTEQHLGEAGLNQDDGTPVAGKSTRWMALKAASHFNMHQSFEILLKLILKLEGKVYGRQHRLGQLYEMLSPDSQEQLDNAYGRAMASIGQKQLTGIGFFYGNDKPDRLPAEEVTTARQGFEHFDETLQLHQRRYQYENIGRGDWTLSIVDMTPWFKHAGRSVSLCPPAARIVRSLGRARAVGLESRSVVEVNLRVRECLLVLTAQAVPSATRRIWRRRRDCPHGCASAQRVRASGTVRASGHRGRRQWSARLTVSFCWPADNKRGKKPFINEGLQKVDSLPP